MTDSSSGQTFSQRFLSFSHWFYLSLPLVFWQVLFHSLPSQVVRKSFMSSCVQSTARRTSCSGWPVRTTGSLLPRPKPATSTASLSTLMPHRRFVEGRANMNEDEWWAGIWWHLLSPQGNLDAETREALLSEMDSVCSNTFNDAQQRIYSLMAKDSFPRFLRSIHCTEAIKACWTCPLWRMRNSYFND